MLGPPVDPESPRPHSRADSITPCSAVRVRHPCARISTASSAIPIEFAVTEAAAGWLITGYALSVVVGALVLTAATIRLPRKPELLGLIVLFIVGNMLTAFALGYDIALLGRIIAALCHGASRMLVNASPHGGRYTIASDTALAIFVTPTVSE